MTLRGCLSAVRSFRLPLTAAALAAPINALSGLWPPGLLVPRRRDRRETKVRVSVGEISVETPSGYKVSARDLSVEVAIPRPYRGPGIA
jgi:hypothetical protein